MTAAHPHAPFQCECPPGWYPIKWKLKNKINKKLWLIRVHLYIMTWWWWRVTSYAFSYDEILSVAPVTSGRHDYSFFDLWVLVLLQGNILLLATFSSWSKKIAVINEEILTCVTHIKRFRNPFTFQQTKKENKYSNYWIWHICTQINHSKICFLQFDQKYNLMRHFFFSGIRSYVTFWRWKKTL